MTRSPAEGWVKQVARNVTGADGAIQNARYLIRDRDAKFSPGFDAILAGAGIQPVKLPPRSPI